MNYTVLITLASLVGTAANAFGKRWCFAVWLFTNAFWCVHNAAIGEWSQAILYLVNFALAIVGLWKWRRKGGAI